MTDEEDAQLRAIHAALVGTNSPANSIIQSIKSDVDTIRAIVQEQIRRNIGGVQYTKTQKQDNEDTNTIARSALFGAGGYDGLISTQQELEDRGYSIGSPDVIDYTAIGNKVREELDKTYFNA